MSRKTLKHRGSINHGAQPQVRRAATLDRPVQIERHASQAASQVPGNQTPSRPPRTQTQRPVTPLAKEKVEHAATRVDLFLGTWQTGSPVHSTGQAGRLVETPADRAEQSSPVVESDASPDWSSQASTIKIILHNSTVHATPGLKQAEPTCLKSPVPLVL